MKLDTTARARDIISLLSASVDVGASDGLKFGESLGKIEGFLLGEIVGLELGFTEGSRLGI